MRERTATAADEAGRPRRGGTCGETPVDLREPLGVGRIGTEEAGGVHARLAVQRVDDEAGVFGDGVDGFSSLEAVAEAIAAS